MIIYNRGAAASAKNGFLLLIRDAESTNSNIGLPLFRPFIALTIKRYLICNVRKLNCTSYKLHLKFDLMIPLVLPDVFYEVGIYW